VLVQTLADIDPQFPTVSEEAREALLVSKAGLEGEAPADVAAETIAAAEANE
jgi:hypothetical protein